MKGLNPQKEAGVEDGCWIWWRRWPFGWLQPWAVVQGEIRH